MYVSLLALPECWHSRPAFLHPQKWKCPRNMKRLLGEENPAQHFLAFVHGFSSSKLLANISKLIPATFLGDSAGSSREEHYLTSADGETEARSGDAAAPGLRAKLRVSAGGGVRPSRCRPDTLSPNKHGVNSLGWSREDMGEKSRPRVRAAGGAVPWTHTLLWPLATCSKGCDQGSIPSPCAGCTLSPSAGPAVLNLSPRAPGNTWAHG